MISWHKFPLRWPVVPRLALSQDFHNGKLIARHRNSFLRTTGDPPLPPSMCRPMGEWFYHLDPHDLHDEPSWGHSGLKVTAFPVPTVSSQLWRPTAMIPHFPFIFSSISVVSVVVAKMFWSKGSSVQSVSDFRSFSVSRTHVTVGNCFRSFTGNHRTSSRSLSCSSFLAP